MARHELKTCNLDYLYDLAKGDMGFVKEMIDVFLADNESELDNLEQKIKDKDFDQIRQIAHKLRSSIPYVGLEKIIGDEIVQMEELGSKGSDIKQITILFKKIREISKDAIAELKDLKF